MFFAYWFNSSKLKKINEIVLLYILYKIAECFDTNCIKELKIRHFYLYPMDVIEPFIVCMDEGIE